MRKVRIRVLQGENITPKFSYTYKGVPEDGIFNKFLVILCIHIVLQYAINSSHVIIPDLSKSIALKKS